MSIKAVITGDIVASSHYPQSTKELALSKMGELFQIHHGRMEIYRGDSFQGLLENPGTALDLAIEIRLMLKLIRNSVKSKQLDCRMAIGIGAIDFKVEKVMEGDGPAYRNSGPYLDKMKKEDRMVFMTPWDEVNSELYTESKMAEALIGRWTYSQAEVIKETITGKSQMKIAGNLNISQSAVNQRLKAASWDAIEAFRQRFKQLVTNK